MSAQLSPPESFGSTEEARRLVRVCNTYPAELMARWHAYLEASGRNRSAAARQAVNEFLKKKGF